MSRGRSESTKKDRLDVYYDGQCPMCASLIDQVRASPRAADFRLHDMHKARSMPFEKAAVEREIHVTDRSGGVRRGADAILTIAEQYPRLQPLARVARTPPIFAFAPLVYRFVAAHRRFLVGAEARLYWLKVAVVLTLMIELALSPHLWVGPRSYPTTPVIDALPPLPGGAAVFLYAAAFALAAAALLVVRARAFLAGLLAVLAIFCAFDQTRWQAWIFQLGFLLAGLASYSWKPSDAAGRDRVLNASRLIIAATYVYSGLQKINANFMDSDFPWLVQPITRLVPQAAGPLHLLGVAAPFLQVAFGLGLLTRRFRRVSLILAVAMHLFILAMLGPLGQNWNDIVWPWTTAMAVFDLLLFGRRPDVGPRQILWPGPSPFPIAALLFFAVLPALSFFNLWDSELSAALYSGNLTEAQIYVDDAGARALPAAIRAQLAHTSADTNVINLQRWSTADLNVIPYPETRVFKRIALALCGRLANPADLALVVREQRLAGSQPETTYRCWDLGPT